MVWIWLLVQLDGCWFSWFGFGSDLVQLVGWLGFGYWALELRVEIIVDVLTLYMKEAGLGPGYVGPSTAVLQPRHLGWFQVSKLVHPR